MYNRLYTIYCISIFLPLPHAKAYYITFWEIVNIKNEKNKNN